MRVKLSFGALDLRLGLSVQSRTIQELVRALPASGVITISSYEPCITINFLKQFEVSFGLSIGKDGTISASGKDASSAFTIIANPYSGFVFEKWQTNTKQISIAD